MHVHDFVYKDAAPGPMPVVGRPVQCVNSCARTRNSEGWALWRLPPGPVRALLFPAGSRQGRRASGVRDSATIDSDQAGARAGSLALRAPAEGRRCSAVEPRSGCRQRKAAYGLLGARPGGWAFERQRVRCWHDCTDARHERAAGTASGCSCFCSLPGM